jgi:acyl-CoA synthetase (NDP forming)
MFPDVAPADLAGIYSWLDGQLIQSYKKYDKPVIVIDPAADVEPESAKIMEAQRVPVYTTPERAADVMAVLYRRKLYLDKINAA